MHPNYGYRYLPRESGPDSRIRRSIHRLARIVPQAINVLFNIASTELSPRGFAGLYYHLLCLVEGTILSAMQILGEINLLPAPVPHARCNLDPWLV